MGDTDRVQRWRQRQREEGLEPMTVWLSHDEKLCLGELAHTWHRSPSELVRQALAQFSPGRSLVTETVADTAQLRVLMQEALLETTAVTEFVTDIVTATLARDLPPLVAGMLQDLKSLRMPGEAVPPPEACTAPATVTDNNVTVTLPQEIPPEAMSTHAYETATVAGTEPSNQARAYGEVPAAVLATLAQRQPATAAEVAKALGYSTKAGTKTVWQALQRLSDSGKVCREGKRQYRLTV
jgi:predicted transcriptional regulator